MNKYNKLRVFFFILLLSIVLWITEFVVHIIIFSEDSLWEAFFSNLSTHELYMRLLVILTCCMMYLLFTKNKIIQDKENQIENILNNVIPVCITDTNFQIVMANDSYWNIWGKPASETIKCYEHRPGQHCHTKKCALTQILNGAEEYVCVSQKIYNNETHYFILTSKPFLNPKKKVAGIIESFQDISDRKKLEDEKANLIDQLQSSLEKVKLLSGFLPICASCKKIRDDKGYWTQIEYYIRDHSQAEFSHGICPDCAKELYPDFVHKKTNDFKSHNQKLE